MAEKRGSQVPRARAPRVPEKVVVAKNSGYCYGVKRAMEQTGKAAEKKHRVYTLGPIIHNPQVVEGLKKDGIYPAKSVDDVENGILILRTHGVEPAVSEKARRKGLEVIDATCPFVKKAQQLVVQLMNEGYTVMIVGEKEHPEVKSHAAYADNKAIIVETADDLKDLAKTKKLGVVVQTTQSQENLSQIVAALIPRVQELRVFNTICNATSRMQDEAAKLAHRSDVMIVVGGRNSANTTRLAKICSEITTTYHIETEKELRKEMVTSGAAVIGIVGGASTPQSFLQKVYDKICQFQRSAASK